MSTGFFDFSNLPLPYIFAILSGYVFASVLAENTSFWRKRESFEKLLIGGVLGLGLLFGAVLPIVWLSAFWLPMTMDYAIELSSYYVLTIFLFLPLTAIITAKISREAILKTFGYAILILPYAFMAEYFSVIVLRVGIEIYPEYLRLVLKPIGDSFFIRSSFSVLFSMSNLIIYQLFVTPLLARSERQLPYFDMRWGKKSRKNWNERLSFFKWSLKRKITILQMRLFSGKKTFIFVGLIFIIGSPLVLIPFDQSYSVFTPKLEESEEEKFSQSEVNPELVMNITQDVKSDNFLCQYYELRFKRYDVVLPNFPYAVKSICVVNPSNCSTLGNLGLPEPYFTGLGYVNNLWVTYDENVSTTFLSDSKDVAEMIMDFSNVSSQTVSFNVTYFQQFNSRNVKFDCDIDYGEWQNNTKSDKYEFIIQNNENITLKILEIEIGALCIADCDLENVEVYLNGNSILHSVNSIKVYSLNIQIIPYSSANITVIIPRQMSES